MAKKKDDVDDILNALQNDFEKKFGDGSASRLTDPSTLSTVDYWISTGNIVVDSVLRGGRPVGSSLLPFGRQVEISGLEHSGKTTLCAQIAAEVQRLGGLVIVTDTEERIAKDYWTKLGVDVSKTLRIQADSVEDVFNKQYEMLTMVHKIASDKPTLMLWDSLGGTSTKDMIDPKSKDTAMTQIKQAYGKSAKDISDGMRLINSIVAETRACYLYTNHMYTKVGATYGPKYETYGGQKPKYMATVRLQLTRVGAIKEKDQFSAKEREIGARIRVRALKNSMAPQMLTRDAVLLGDRGFVNDYSVFDEGVKAGVITKAGAWSTWKAPSGEEIKFQGFNGFETKVVPHPEYTELFSQVNASL